MTGSSRSPGAPPPCRPSPTRRWRRCCSAICPPCLEAGAPGRIPDAPRKSSNVAGGEQQGGAATAEAEEPSPQLGPEQVVWVATRVAHDGGSAPDRRRSVGALPESFRPEADEPPGQHPPPVAPKATADDDP